MSSYFGELIMVSNIVLQDLNDHYALKIQTDDAIRSIFYFLMTFLIFLV